MHTPVLLHEVIEHLNLAAGKQIVDATLDGGGHSLAIESQFPDVRVLGIEFDPVEYQEFTEAHRETAIIAVNDSYEHMREIVQQYSIKPDGVLFDLGVSSWHYASSKRGFSFQANEPLDMRFNPDKEQTTAAEVVNTSNQQELEKILTEYGEEQFAPGIARAIVKARQVKPILSTFDLVAVINDVVPNWYKHRKIHPATKTFQALRMAVNHELAAIRSGLEAAIDVLEPKGRLVVISFQGLEDKMVRTVFREAVTAGKLKWVTKDTVKPKWSEIKQNPRSRSAKMKIAEKI